MLYQVNVFKSLQYILDAINIAHGWLKIEKINIVMMFKTLFNPTF